MSFYRFFYSPPPFSSVFVFFPTRLKVTCPRPSSPFSFSQFPATDPSPPVPPPLSRFFSVSGQPVHHTDSLRFENFFFPWTPIFKRSFGPPPVSQFLIGEACPPDLLLVFESVRVPDSPPQTGTTTSSSASPLLCKLPILLTGPLTRVSTPNANVLIAADSLSFPPLLDPFPSSSADEFFNFSFWEPFQGQSSIFFSFSPPPSSVRKF